MKAKGIIVVLVVAALVMPAVLESGVGQGMYPHKNPAMLPQQCGSCHVGHGRSGTHLLPLEEEQNCYRCHGERGEFDRAAEQSHVNPAARRFNLYAVFQKPFRHPVEVTGAHRADEVLPESNTAAPRHAECVDCHNAHNAKPVPPLPQKGVAHRQSPLKGIDLEFELCYRCHSSSANKPHYSRDISRLVNPVNPSYHPIEAPSRNMSMSLLPPLKPTSIISCTDCHGNDDPTGPRGPHGSNYEGMLVEPYILSDGAPESESTYLLCYSCHDRMNIMSDLSFPLHSRHVDQGRISCNSCHDPHGSEEHAALINFDRIYAGAMTNIVSPSSSGRISFMKMGLHSGECYLTCHGKDHNPAVY